MTNPGNLANMKQVAVRDSRIANDTLLSLEIRLTEIAKTMRENKTIQAYEMLRQIQEFIAYERAKQTAQ